MVMSGHQEAREHFANAYKCYTLTLLSFWSFVLIIYTIVLLVAIGAAISQGYGGQAILAGLATIVGMIIGFGVVAFLLIHYLKVVQSYAHRVDHHSDYIDSKC